MAYQAQATYPTLANLKITEAEGGMLTVSGMWITATTSGPRWQNFLEDIDPETQTILSVAEIYRESFIDDLVTDNYEVSPPAN